MNNYNKISNNSINSKHNNIISTLLYYYFICITFITKVFKNGPRPIIIITTSIVL